MKKKVTVLEFKKLNISELSKKQSLKIIGGSLEITVIMPSPSKDTSSGIC